MGPWGTWLETRVDGNLRFSCKKTTVAQIQEDASSISLPSFAKRKF